MVQELNDKNFGEEVLKSPVPYLVDFWAPWCAPCTMIAATVDAVADKYGDKLRVGKLNVDDNPETTARYSVMGIPTLILFTNGVEQEKFVGVVPRADIERIIDVHM